MTTENKVKDVLGRMADEAPPALEFEDLDAPVVGKEGATARQPMPGWIVAVSGVAAFAGILLVGTLVLSTVQEGSALQEDLPATVGTPTAATSDQFEAVVPPAVEALAGAPGFEAIQTSFIEDHLGIAVWLDARPNGDFVAIQRTDLDVTETAWWLGSDRPPAGGARISTSVTVRADDVVYTATADPDRVVSDWHTDTSPPPNYPRGTLGFEMALLSTPYDELLVADGAEIERQDLIGGGEVWRISDSIEDSDFLLSWFLDGDGRLQGFSGGLRGANESIALDSGVPLDSWRIRFTPLDDPAPITAPDVTEPLEISGFELPDALPLDS